MGSDELGLIALLSKAGGDFFGTLAAGAKALHPSRGVASPPGLESGFAQTGQGSAAGGRRESGAPAAFRGAGAAPRRGVLTLCAALMYRVLFIPVTRATEPSIMLT